MIGAKKKTLKKRTEKSSGFDFLTFAGFILTIGLMIGNSMDSLFLFNLRSRLMNRAYGQIKIPIFALFFLSIFVSGLFCQTNMVRIIKRDVVLKLKPNNESITIMNLPLGAVFEIEETIGEWIKINLPPDKDGVVIMGYVNMSFHACPIIS